LPKHRQAIAAARVEVAELRARLDTLQARTDELILEILALLSDSPTHETQATDVT
jgi:hypothetical protein